MKGKHWLTLFSVASVALSIYAALTGHAAVALAISVSAGIIVGARIAYELNR